MYNLNNISLKKKYQNLVIAVEVEPVINQKIQPVVHKEIQPIVQELQPIIF